MKHILVWYFIWIENRIKKLNIYRVQRVCFMYSFYRPVLTFSSNTHIAIKTRWRKLTGFVHFLRGFFLTKNWICKTSLFHAQTIINLLNYPTKNTRNDPTNAPVQLFIFAPLKKIKHLSDGKTHKLKNKSFID